MISRKAQLATLAVGVLALTALAGCGSSSSSSSGSSGDNTSASSGYGAPGKSSDASSTGSGVVDVANNPKLGKIIVDDKGLTLYYFLADTKGKSTCYDACAAAWPPYTTDGDPTAGPGAEASLLGTTERTDGTTQVTYNKFPLYTYVSDTKPGDITGNDFDNFGAEWYALTPSGEKPED